MYTSKQVDAVAKELRERVNKNTVTDFEVILVVLTMWKSHRIDINGIITILFTAFSGNRERILEGLEGAMAIADDKLIDKIIKDIKEATNE